MINAKCLVMSAELKQNYNSSFITHNLSLGTAANSPLGEWLKEVSL